MAIRATKKKTVATSRSATKTIDRKYYGPEPVDISGKYMTDVYNWYNYMFDHDQAREWLIDYMTANDSYSREDVSHIKGLPKYDIPTTVGWIARILMNGNNLENLSYFHSRVSELLTSGRNEVSETKETKTVSVADRAAAKIQSIITDIEYALDAPDTFCLYDFLKEKDATTQAANVIRDRYIKVYNEVMDDSCEQVRESFGKRLKTEQKFWQSFIDDCDRYAGNKKKTTVRKPRAKKQKPVSDIIKSMNYQKEYAPLKIVSVNPTDIVGAQQIWTYNTKYKKLSRYDAVGPAGISVKGTTLTGFDVEKSVTKILRKPDVVITNLLSAGKISLRKIMTEIKTSETEATGRINTDTILLRVIK